MTASEFNKKYDKYIPEGWYGLSFDIPNVTEYLDKVMEDLITIPGFELHQIKLKFNMEHKDLSEALGYVKNRTSLYKKLHLSFKKRKKTN